MKHSSNSLLNNYQMLKEYKKSLDLRALFSQIKYNFHKKHKLPNGEIGSKNSWPPSAKVLNNNTTTMNKNITLVYIKNSLFA